MLGIGYASVRDLVSFFRYKSANRGGIPNPLISTMSEIKHALAFGVSQSGRFLRHFLELGMNADDEGRQVFDGVFSHVAGAGKVFANHSFGMPGRTATQHEDRLYPENWFPFSTAKTADPVSGRIGALLSGAATDPKIIETNSATEYWQKGASLIHTDPGLRRDLPLPENSRAYLIAGTQHGGRPGVDPRPGPCVNPRNPHSATPALRALFAALEDWVVARRRAAAEPGAVAHRRHRRHRRRGQDAAGRRICPCAGRERHPAAGRLDRSARNIAAGAVHDLRLGGRR